MDRVNRGATERPVEWERRYPTMPYQLLANGLVLIHLGFVVFVALGGLLVLRWPRLAWIHLPAVAWGVWIEWAGWLCPLTPLENRLRRLAGEAGYHGGFVEHYLLPLLYPRGMSRSDQVILGALVLAVNLLVYGILLRRLARRRRKSGTRVSADP